MAFTFNKGLRLNAGQTVVKLNNRVFESPTGSAFITVRPDAPATNEKVVLLSPGDDNAGHLEISIQHQNAGTPTAGYYFVIETLGSSRQSTNTLQSELLSYGSEVTLGVSYDAANSDVVYAISGRGLESSPTELSPFNTPNDVSRGGPDDFDKDTDDFESIGLDKYNGFVSLIATYDEPFWNGELLKYVEDPNTLPIKNRAIYLDATQLSAVSAVDNSRVETQKITFGPAYASGTITIDGLPGVAGATGVKVVVRQGDSANLVAEKVRAALADSAMFKPQREKQLLTFSVDTANGELAGPHTIKLAAGNTSIEVDLLATNDASDIALAVQGALENDALTVGGVVGTLSWAGFKTGRAIQNNNDGSLLLTFAASETDAAPISIDSADSPVSVSVDTVQTYNATGVGRGVSTDGSAVLINFNRADWDARDLNVSSGATGVKITKPYEDEPDHQLEFSSYLPSVFNFSGTPVSEIQKIMVTEAATKDGSLNIDINGQTATLTFDSDTYTLASTAADIAAMLKEDVKYEDMGISELTVENDSVLVTFNVSEKNVDSITIADDDSNVLARISDVRQYAQGLPGEIQTITFTKADAGGGTFTIDDVEVTVAANATAAAVATTVQKALVESVDSKYSTPEIQSLTFLNGSDGAIDATYKIAGVDFTPSANADTETIASEAATAITNSLPTGIASAVADGDSVILTFLSSQRDAKIQPGLVVTNGDDGISATAFETIQEFNANGKRSTKINADNSLSIEYRPEFGDVLPVRFFDTDSGVMASVATTRAAHLLSVSSSGYTGGGQTTTAGATASNALYAQLVSANAASGDNRDLVFDVYVNPNVKDLTKVGLGYESVSFSLGYSAADVVSDKVRIDMAPTNSAPVTNLNTPGQIVARWLSTTSTTDFTKPIARVSMSQIGSAGSFKDTLDLTFTAVDIDGVDLTNGVQYTPSFGDTLMVDRYDVTQKLVNGLDSSTAVGGQFVGYYGSPVVNNPQISLKYAAMTDKGVTTGPTLASADKTVSMNVVSGVTGASKVKFAIDLPSNASAVSFEPSAGFTATPTSETVLQGLKGRTYFVEGSFSSALAKDAAIGTFKVDLSTARDIKGNAYGPANLTHEFSFAGTPSLTVGANTISATSQNLYVGYTSTAASGTNKGTWQVNDVPKGTFNKFVLPTAPTNADKVITAADALQILKISAGYGLDWKSNEMPLGAYAAADLDGSGKITATDALIALRYATGTIPNPDPVKWIMFDSTTSNLSVDSVAINGSLKADMPVTEAGINTDNKLIEIMKDNTFSDYFVQAILVGNLTNPALEV